jgi:acetolactate synthase regulatory subunit
VNNIYHLELEVLNDAAVLLRIVSICHQRRYRIVSLHYEHSAGAPVGCVRLGVEAGHMQSERMEMWLAKLVHVLRVRVSPQVPVGSREPPPRRAVPLRPGFFRSCADSSGPASRVNQMCATPLYDVMGLAR